MSAPPHDRDADRTAATKEQQPYVELAQAAPHRA